MTDKEFRKLSRAELIEIMGKIVFRVWPLTKFGTVK